MISIFELKVLIFICHLQSTGDLEEIHAILRLKNVDIDEEDDDGSSVLPLAIQNGSFCFVFSVEIIFRERVMEILCEFSGNDDVVNLLIMNGININHKNSDLKTGLHIAAEQGDSLIKVEKKIHLCNDKCKCS